MGSVGQVGCCLHGGRIGWHAWAIVGAHDCAAATISTTYIGFVLGAMGTDYYPRLTATIHDHEAVNRLVNEQTEVALLLAGPVFLAMLGLAPWVIELLYSSSFHPAAEVLRWQVLGDVLKVCSWPLGFIILAAGDGRTFMLSETVAVTVFVLLTWLLLPFLGVLATGLAFVGMYAVHLPFVYLLAQRRTGFVWIINVRRQFVALLISGSLILVMAEWSALASGALGLLLSAGFTLYSLNRLANKTTLAGPLNFMAGFSRKLMIKLGILRG